MNLIRREDADHIGTPIGGQKKTDAYGCEYIYCYCAAAVLINTPYPLVCKAYGMEALAIAAAGVAKIGVADKAVASGKYGWFAVYGPHDVVVTSSATATDGDAIKIHTDGKPISDATPMVAAGEVDQFACALEAKGSGTAVTVKCFLIDKSVITWT